MDKRVTLPHKLTEFGPGMLVVLERKFKEIERLLSLSFTGKHTQDIGDGVALSFSITHNLRTRDLFVSVRENAAPYAMITPDNVEMTDVNTITVEFAAAPTAGQYKVIILG